MRLRGRLRIFFCLVQKSFNISFIPLTVPEFLFFVGILDKIIPREIQKWGIFKSEIPEFELDEVVGPTF